MKLENTHRRGLVDHGKALLAAHPRSNVAICYYDNPECQGLAHEIAALLYDAGWSRTLRPLVKLLPVRGEIEGSGIVVADEPVNEAKTLVKMLKDSGIDAKSRHVKMHKPHEPGPSERQGPKRMVGTEELLLEIWPD